MKLFYIGEQTQEIFLFKFAGNKSYLIFDFISPHFLTAHPYKSLENENIVYHYLQ